MEAAGPEATAKSITTDRRSRGTMGGLPQLFELPAEIGELLFEGGDFVF
jgi:hypothetical protein